MDIYELNKRRAEAQAHVYYLGMMNQPVDPDKRIAADAAYRLATDALMRAEVDYQRALASMTTEELIALTH